MPISILVELNLLNEIIVTPTKIKKTAKNSIGLKRRLAKVFSKIIVNKG